MASDLVVLHNVDLGDLWTELNAAAFLVWRATNRRARGEPPLWTLPEDTDGSEAREPTADGAVQESLIQH